MNWAQAASLRQQGVIYHTNSEELRDKGGKGDPIDTYTDYPYD
ncbi:hypothetical protein HMPREF9075_00533 [Capnocytophaga sp. oral taxon 332 str. F0381]|nr:hypothetical protein [Capnocytophaga sp. oral taxon 332]EKY11831.1 hypothetical protein HMPREF9075_00533 [Capnocytophaga sp. oral taxon 332 str. F0381]